MRIHNRKGAGPAHVHAVLMEAPRAQSPEPPPVAVNRRDNAALLLEDADGADAAWLGAGGVRAVGPERAGKLLCLLFGQLGPEVGKSTKVVRLHHAKCFLFLKRDHACQFGLGHCRPTNLVPGQLHPVPVAQPMEGMPIPLGNVKTLF